MLSLPENRFIHIVKHGLILMALGATCIVILGRGLWYSGVNTDDAFPMLAAQGIVAHNSDASVYFSVSVFGMKIPLLLNYYFGPWQSYMAVPFVAAIQDPANAVRAYVLFWAVACVWLTYLLSYALSNDALLSAFGALALTTSSYLVTQTQWGFVFSGVADAAVCCGALLCLIRAYEKRSTEFWYASCALAGLGPGLAPQAGAFSIAWVGIALLMRRIRLGKRLPSFLWLALGIAPMILGNVLFGLISVQGILDHLHRPARGLDNFDYIHNLSVRLKQLYFVWGSAPQAVGMLRQSFEPFFLAGCFCFSVFAFMRSPKGTDEAKMRLLPPLFMAVILLLSAFTLFGFDLQHLFILLPLGIVTAAAVPRQFPRKFSWIARALIGSSFFFSIVQNSDGIRTTWEHLRNEGDFPPQSRMSSALAGWLLQQGSPSRVFLLTQTDGTVNVLDANTLKYLTKGKINFITEIELPAAASGARSLELSARPAAHDYLIVETGMNLKTDMSAIKIFYAKSGHPLRLEQTFKRPGGALVYSVYVPGARRM